MTAGQLAICSSDVQVGIQITKGTRRHVARRMNLSHTPDAN